MKTAKIVAAIALPLAVAITTVWILRDRIIQRLSGPMLAKFELEITDVSLDAIAGGDAAISRLELRHISGTTITIEDIVLNVRKASANGRRHQAGRVTIAMAETPHNDPPDVANLVRQALAMPNSLPPLQVAVGELLVPPYPPLRDVTWSVFVDRQVIDARLHNDRIRLQARVLAPAKHEVKIDLTTEPGESESARMRIDEGPGAVTLHAESRLELAVLQQQLHHAGLLPAGLTVDTAEALVDLHMNIPDDPAAALTLEATLAPAAPWRLHTADNAVIDISAASAARFEAGDPSQTWAMSIDDLQVSLAGQYAGAIKAEAVRCVHGISCTLAATLSIEALALTDGNLDSTQIRALLELRSNAAGSATQVVLQPGATILITGISLASSTISSVSASLESGADITRDESGLRASADSNDTVVKRVSAAGVTADGTLLLEDAALEIQDGILAGRVDLFTPAIDLVYADTRFTMPGVRGDMKLADQRLAAQLATVGLQQEGRIQLTSDLATETGEIRVAGAVNAFTDRPLTQILDGLPDGFDLTSGELGVEGGFAWRPRLSPRGEARLSLNEVAGFYSAIAFTGVTTAIDFNYHARHGLSAEPASARAAFVDIGIGLTDLEATYRLWPSEESVDVTALEFRAFGGMVHTEPFSLDTSLTDKIVTVHVDSLDLAEVLTMQDFESIDVTGRIDAELPVTLGDGGIRVDAGRLTGLAPGGVIRYRQGAPAPQSNGGAMDIAMQALSNFEYDTLSSEVSYTEGGDLILKMRLTGRNPDLEGNRPIVLNLGVENNIPQMLRSLQASRNVRDILERRVNR